MKVKYEFDLPEEEWEFEIYQNAMKLARVITDLDREMRDNIKHGEDDLTTSHWRKRLFELAEEEELAQNVIGG